MWKTHQKSTSSRSWREFSWKNLIRFFITPKARSKYLKMSQPCWRGCGSINADHAHIFWECDKVQIFWRTVHKTLREVLRYEIPMCVEVLYLCNFKEEYVHRGDRHLLNILLTAGKKAITRRWGRIDSPTKEQWMEIIDQIYEMEQLTHRLRLQKPQMENNWLKWTIFKNLNSDKDN